VVLPKDADDRISKFLEQAQREEHKLRMEAKEDASGASILDGFVTVEEMLGITNHFISKNNTKGHRNRLLALLSYALCTR
jgi:hypothetical protein